MDEKHEKRAQAVVRPTVDLTTRVFNALVKEAHAISSSPIFMAVEHEWMRLSLSASRDILDNIAKHQEAIQSSFESALSDALLRLPAEELSKKKAEAHILEANAPATVGELKQRLSDSLTYAAASLGQIKGLQPEAQEYCLQVYTGLQDHLNGMAQELLSRRMRSV